MNIFNKVALQGLLKSRTRTIVTIIGVMLSAAMMIGVATFATSLQHYMVNGSILKYGDWHVSFSDVDEEFRQQQLQDERIANMITFENIGYATLEQSKNEQKPYAFVAGFQDETYENLPITLTSSHYPSSETEILVPSHLKENAEIALSVGDQLTLNVGQRLQMTKYFLNRMHTKVQLVEQYRHQYYWRVYYYFHHDGVCFNDDQKGKYYRSIT